MAMSRWGLDKLLRSRSSDKLVSLLLPDGSMEMFGEGKTVADIMAEYPGHYVGSITSSRPCLAPEKALHPGSTYYLEPEQSPLKGAKSLPSNNGKDVKGLLPDGDRNERPAPRSARKETRKDEREGNLLAENGQAAGFIPRRMSLDAGAVFSRQLSADGAALAAAVAASSSMRHSDYVFDDNDDNGDDGDNEEMISPFQAANRVVSRRASLSDAASARSAAASLAEARQLWQDETNMRHHSQPRRVNSFSDLTSVHGGGNDCEFNGYNPAAEQQSPFPQLERQPSCCRSCGGCACGGGSMRSSRCPSPAPPVRSPSAAAFPDFEGGDIARGCALDSAYGATGGRSGRRALHRGAGSAQDGYARPAFPDYDASAAAAACGLVPSPSPPPPGLAHWQQQQTFSRSATYSRNDTRENDTREYDSPRDPLPAPRARFPSAPSTPVRRTSLDHRAMRAGRPHPADASAAVASLRGGSPRADVRSVFSAIDSDNESHCDDGEIADEEGSVKSGYSLPSPQDAAAAEERRREREKREWMIMQRQMMRQQHMLHQQQRQQQQQQQMQHHQMQQFQQQQQMHSQQQQARHQISSQQRASSPRLHHQHHIQHHNQHHNQQQQQPRLSRRSANSASGRSAGLPPRAVSPLPPIPANHVSPPNSCDFLCSPGAAPGSQKHNEMTRDGDLITEDSRSRSCASLSSLSAEFVVAHQSAGMSSWGSYPSLESLSPEGSSLAGSSPRHHF
ncbi:unnamed protein product [Closterium sp. Yama58-4]|nr:unnamed protein product [Closterium sp. Yama58-4]